MATSDLERQERATTIRGIVDDCITDALDKAFDKIDRRGFKSDEVESALSHFEIDVSDAWLEYNE